MNVGVGKFLRDGLTLASVEQAFRRVAASVSAGFLVEHKEDGTHGNITADTVAATGGMSLEPSTNADADATDIAQHSYGFAGSHDTFGLWGLDTGDLYFLSLRAVATPTTHSANVTISSSVTGADTTAIALLSDVSLSRINVTANEINLNGTVDVELITTPDHITIEANNKFLRGWNTGAVVKNLIGVNSSDVVSIDSGALGAVFGSSIRERARTTPMGEWTSPSFSAGDYTGSGTITWTVASGDVATYAYIQIGKTMTVAFAINTTSVSGTGTELRIAIPAGATSAKQITNPIRVIDNGTGGIGFARVDASATVIACFVDGTGATNWAGAADTTHVRGEITFETT